MIHVIIAVLIYILVGPFSVWAAIDCASDAGFEIYKGTPADPEALAYTVPNVPNRFTFFCFGQRSGTSPRTYPTPDYGGVSLTALTTETYTDPTAGVCFYGLNNLPTGSNNFNVNWSAAPLADAFIFGTCSGVNQSSPIRSGSNSQSTGTSTTLSTTISNIVTGDVGISFAVIEATAANDFTVTGSNQNVLNQGNAGNEIAGIATWKTGANGGAHSYSFPENQQYSFHWFAIVPATDARPLAPMELD